MKTIDENGAHLFETQKKLRLSSVDLSRKGSIDDHISELVCFINEQSEYFTMSSCSGRVSIIEEVLLRFKKRYVFI